MILIISTCKYQFSEYEFVHPIIEIVKELNLEYDVRKYYEKMEFDKYSKIIICGTALKDFDYLNYIDNFKMLTKYNGGVLGICAGYQILGKLYSCKIDRIRKIGIGKVRVIKRNPLIDKESFYAYFLHILGIKERCNKIEVLALQDNEICMFKVRGKSFYGISFHPEVLNRVIIINFLSN